MEKILLKLFSYWMIFVRLLGKVNTFVFLSLIYFIIISPFAIFLKLIGKDLLNIKLLGSQKSYWLKKENKILEPKDYEQGF